ncbi:MAG TPA: metallophosphoesterase [Candidatus Kapabacteria bacterium]|nr:metallophosphoesterase [Candidatus Kapabacteria bacterium]
MSNKLDESNGGISRRGFLECMAWLGTGAVWTMTGGVLRSEPLTNALALGKKSNDFTFVQISDTHIGFSKDANKDVISTLQSSLSMIDALPVQPDLLLHTGDLTHLAKPEQFDTLAQMLSSLRVKEQFFSPGEHDVASNNNEFLQRYGKKTKGDGWQSFDHKGVHFIGLVNVMNLKAGGMGSLGAEQLEWLERDVKHISHSTPIVVFAHIPLWSVYPDWGWGTDDSAQALGYLKKFGSVTVLNGHIHQVMQKVEGNVTFHTAMSTAFPQPKPGTAKSPGPMKVNDDALRTLLGTTTISRMSSDNMIAIVDRPIVSASGMMMKSDENHPMTSADHTVTIDNFKFTPEVIEVATGSTVRFLNKDDIPHQVVANNNEFKSPLLDTDQFYDTTLTAKGVVKYYCSLHPKMTGEIHIL